MSVPTEIAQDPPARAHWAFQTALGILHPDAVALRNGSVLLTERRDLLGAYVVRALHEQLQRRATDRASDDRLLAEAVGVLGAEIAIARGESPGVGATAALDRYLHAPGLDRSRRTEADAILRYALTLAAVDDSEAADRLARMTGEARPAALSGITATSEAISLDARMLHTAVPPAQRPTGQRNQVGSRHRAAGAGRRFQTERVRSTGMVSGSRPASAPGLDDQAVLAVLAGMGPDELGLTKRPTVDNGLVVLQVADEPQYVKVEVGRTLSPWVAEGALGSGTATDPHVLRLSPGLADAQLRGVLAHQVCQLTQELAAARASRPRGILNRLKSVFSHDTRDRRLKADHAAYQLLTQDWQHAKAETQAFGRPTGARSLGDIERDLEGLAKQITFHGGAAPVLPWAPGAVLDAKGFGIAAARAEAEANPPRFTQGHLRNQVTQQIGNLEAAVADLELKADAKSRTAQGARLEAEKLDRKAGVEVLDLDRGAPERGRKMQVLAGTARNKARRHEEIAGGYSQAAAAARQALAEYRLVVAEMDLAGTPERVAEVAATARQRVAAYQRSVAEAVPSPELLATGVPTGKRLELPVDDINRVLAAQGITQRLLPEAPLPVPGAQYRRLLSPDGMVFSVGGDPDDPIGKVAQVRVRMKARDVTEVIDHDYDLAEQMSGTLGEGGTNVSTTDTHATTQNVGVSLQPIIAMAGAVVPGAGAAAAFVSAGANASRGRTVATTGGASWSVQEGRVDDNRGESLLYDWDGELEIEVRRSPTEPWSPVETVDMGRQLTWVSSAYTVKAPSETVTLAGLGRVGDLSKTFPRCAVTNIRGLQSVSDRVVAQAAERYGGIDRVTHDHINGMIVHDTHRLLRAAARPGGITRRIPSGGETDYALTWEVVPVWADAELVGEASTEMRQEEVLVDFAGGNTGQVVSTSLNGTGTVSVPAAGPLQSVAGSTIGVSPNASVGRGVSRSGGQNVSATNITPYVHRSQGPTQGVLVGMRVKATLRKLTDTEQQPVVVEDDCRAFLRVAENDLLRAGGPVDKNAVRRNLDGTVKLDRKGRALLRGDPEPSTDPRTPMPPWMGPGPNQLRGVGKGMAQNLEGADEAQRQALLKLSEMGLVPQLDANLQPRGDRAAYERDPLRRASQYANYERVVQQLTAPRLQAGFNQACQGGLVVMLEDHRTGHAPHFRPFRLSVRQDFAGTEHIGTAFNENAVLLAISSRSSGNTFGQGKSLPVSAGIGGSDGPDKGVAGLAGKVGLTFSRTTLGRNFTYTVGRRVNRVGLNESTGALEKFEQPIEITFAEITDRGDQPIAVAGGTVELAYDSALCKADPPVFEADPKRPTQAAIDAGQLVAADAGNPADRIAAALPAFRADGSALASLHAALSPNSLVANPQWMNGEYRLPMTVVRAPGSPAEALADGTLLPAQYQVVVRGAAKSLTFAAISDQNTVDINFTMNDVGFTSGTSASGGVSVDASGGPAAADGSSRSGGISAGRTGGRSQSTTDSRTTGEERLLVNPGTHYEFLERHQLVADIVHDGKVIKSLPLDDVLAQKAMAERRALELYATNELDLPLEVTADAAERWLNDKLPLEPRVAAGFVRRYQQDKAGATTGLAAGHANERLIAKARSTREGAQASAAGGLDVGAQVQQAADVPRIVHLAEPNDRSMAAGQFEKTVVEGTNRKVDLRDLVLPQFEELRPGLVAATPVLRDSLDVDLDPDSYQGHFENMLGPGGFEAVTEVAVPGQRRPDLYVVQVSARFDGPAVVDDGPVDDEGNLELPQQEAGSILQGYDYRTRDRNVSRTTTYSGGVNGGGSTGGGTFGANGGIGTDRTRTHSAGSGEQNTTLDRLGHFDLVKVRRKVVFTTRVVRLRAAGSAVLTSAGWKIGRLHPRDVIEVSAPRELRADLTALVPRGEVTAAPAAARAVAEQAADRRQFRLSEGAVPVRYQPYRQGDNRKQDELFNNLTGYLADDKRLGAAGVAQYRQLMKTLLQPTAAKAQFERLVNDGIQLPPMARPGNSRRTVGVTVQATPIGWELMDPLLVGQVGKVRREQNQHRSSESGNHATPLTVTGGFSAGAVSGSTSFGEQVKDQSAEANGTRSETSKFEEGMVVTVRIPVRYDATVQTVNDRGRTGAPASETVRLTGLAQGEYYVRMLMHDYLDGLRQLEAGKPMDAVQAAARLRAVPEKLGPADIRTTDYADGRSWRSYQPLLAALELADAEGRDIVLRVEEKDKTERWYHVRPGWQLTGVNDGDFGAAFATVHPTLVRMAEGRFDLRDLYNTSSPEGSFNAKVAAKLEESGVPRDVLKGLDLSTTTRYLNGAPHPSAKSPSSAAAGRTIAPTGHGPSVSGL